MWFSSVVLPTAQKARDDGDGEAGVGEGRDFLAWGEGEWMGGWVDGWMGGWVDGWMGE